MFRSVKVRRALSENDALLSDSNRQQNKTLFCLQELLTAREAKLRVERKHKLGEEGDSIAKERMRREMAARGEGVILDRITGTVEG